MVNVRFWSFLSVLHAPEGEATGGGGGGGESAPVDPNDGSDTPEAPDLRAFIEKVDARLGDMGRQLAKLRAKPDSPKPDDEAPATAPPPGLSEQDLAAAMGYGRLHTSLPENAQKMLDDMQAEGASFRDLERYAKLAASVMSTQDDTAPPKKRPAGHAGTPGSSNPSRPTTLTELQNLYATDEKAYSKLMADPSFDPSELPM